MTEKLAIIGSGPAAWTAAIYAARANLNPVVYEGEPSRAMVPGGQLMFTTEVENYPGFPSGIQGPDLMELLRKQAENFQTRVQAADITSVQFGSHPFLLKSSEGKEVEALAVIIATGAMANWLNLPNEQRLAHSGGGVSACAICDGGLPAYRDKVLAVVGGGDSAIEESLYLTKFASKVILIHRRDSLRASPIMQERAKTNPKIEFKWNSIVTDVLGDKVISGLTLQDTKTKEETTLDCGGLFVAIGHTPNVAFLDDQITLDEKGFIATPTPWRTATSVEGVFAAGDVMDPYFKQAITAAGTGCMSALEAERWITFKGFA
ncbi:MAG: thioredoxin-disulfide reductase [Candidatus Scalindua sp. AMX11]|nr:MAG: thioredoxin-disulfide reductase [Candidatus Scalindua sp.]NOG83631.1 thioredoxin-disulfide reductase [Planctomycetota bacterium]RZV69659.1 MAG: thioredoxin-disulfide reductase [Candidatus Scalindua sp. SCAELEC01]TDE64119.1 MAG: thioredoxin-disulfide reductase [Candidatus Scalindua sp. AMX11]GJQ60135.1 MAG: thioredoxin reductase [Candidatus Scalindua sp.]